MGRRNGVSNDGETKAKGNEEHREDAEKAAN